MTAGDVGPCSTNQTSKGDCGSFVGFPGNEQKAVTRLIGRGAKAPLNRHSLSDWFYRGNVQIFLSPLHTAGLFQRLDLALFG
jgi:hypothetical protein